MAHGTVLGTYDMPSARLNLGGEVRIVQAVLASEAKQAGHILCLVVQDGAAQWLQATQGSAKLLSFYGWCTRAIGQIYSDLFGEFWHVPS